MKSDYIVQYGFNFSHLSEYQIFKRYGDALKFFSTLDRNMYQSAFIYKQGYIKNNVDLGFFVADTVEYKKHYTEIKQNSRVLQMMRDGLKF